MTTIAKAQNYTLMHRSQADDRQKDPVKRRVQFWMERIINSLDGIQEISDTQAASGLLGLRAVLCTDPLKIVPTKESYNYLRSTRVGKAYDCHPEYVESSDEDDEFDEDSDDDSFIEPEDLFPEDDSDADSHEENHTQQDRSDATDADIDSYAGEKSDVENRTHQERPGATDLCDTDSESDEQSDDDTAGAPTRPCERMAR